MIFSQISNTNQITLLRAANKLIKHSTTATWLPTQNMPRLWNRRTRKICLIILVDKGVTNLRIRALRQINKEGWRYPYGNTTPDKQDRLIMSYPRAGANIHTKKNMPRGCMRWSPTWRSEAHPKAKVFRCAPKGHEWKIFEFIWLLIRNLQISFVILIIKQQEPIWGPHELGQETGKIK